MAGRTLVADHLEGWYDGLTLVLARTTFEGSDGGSSVDFLYEQNAPVLAVEREAQRAETRTYFANSQRQQSATESMALEVQATLAAYSDGRNVTSPATE